MSRASRLARRSKAEEALAEGYAAQRLAAIRRVGGDERTLATAMLTVGAYLAAGMDGALTVADDLEDLARDLRAKVKDN